MKIENMGLDEKYKLSEVQLAAREKMLEDRIVPE